MPVVKKRWNKGMQINIQNQLIITVESVELIKQIKVLKVPGATCHWIFEVVKLSRFLSILNFLRQHINAPKCLICRLEQRNAVRKITTRTILPKDTTKNCSTLNKMEYFKSLYIPHRTPEPYGIPFSIYVKKH